MSVISRVTVVPSRLTVLVHTLRLLDEPVDRRRVLSMMFPETLRRVSLEGEEETPSASADELLKEALALGLISAHGPAISLSAAGQSMAVDPRAWLHESLTRPDVANDRGQREVPSALVWLLSIDPLDGLSWQTNYRMTIQSDLGATPGLSNLADFQQLFHWARFLGYCWWARASTGIKVVPDPTEAILLAVEADEIPVDTRIPVREFIDFLGAACPILEGGAARIATSDRLPEARIGGLAAGHFSASTGLALERLAAMGRVDLEAAADAELLVAGPPGTTGTRISHMTFRRAGT